MYKYIFNIVLVLNRLTVR